jgi:hypothetical protein
MQLAQVWPTNVVNAAAAAAAAAAEWLRVGCSLARVLVCGPCEHLALLLCKTAHCLYITTNALLLSLLWFLLLLLLLLQLTDVDPPYGKAPTAQLADKLAGEGTAAAELFDGPREMVLETQVWVTAKRNIQRGSLCSYA